MSISRVFDFSGLFGKCLKVLAGLVLILTIAGCQSEKDTLSVVTGGKTDEPAPGFASVGPGSEEDFILNVGRRVYFAQGSAEIDSVSQETLDLQASWLNQYPNWLVKIQGFSDDPGSAISNNSISDKRANAVMNYLASKGVNAQRMWAKGYGKERLVTTGCSNAACKAVNRRAVVNLQTQFDEAAPQFKGN